MFWLVMTILKYVIILKLWKEIIALCSTISCFIGDMVAFSWLKSEPENPQLTNNPIIYARVLFIGYIIDEFWGEKCFF